MREKTVTKLLQMLMRARSLISLTVLFVMTCHLSGFTLTLEQLQNDPKLNPKRFANYFSDFSYVFHPELQPVDVFLKTRQGDCDDYAVLADRVLHPKGFSTRLIFVRLLGLTSHVVCYVDQEKGYLDYNNRVYFIKIERSGATVREIANKVSKSLTANWTSASELTVEDGIEHFGRTIVKTDSPKNDLIDNSHRTINVDF
jgi:hypothetical protein